MGYKADTQSLLWLVYSASSTRNTGDRDTPHTMTKARSARRHSKAAARATSHLTPLSRPPSRLPQCQLDTHSPGTHTANAQALLHSSQNISVQEQGEAKQHSHAALPSLHRTGPQLSLPAAGQQLSTDSSKSPFFLSLFPIPSLSRLKPATHIQTHVPTATAPHTLVCNTTPLLQKVQPSCPQLPTKENKLNRIK